MNGIAKAPFAYCAQTSASRYTAVDSVFILPSSWSLVPNEKSEIRVCGGCGQMEGTEQVLVTRRVLHAVSERTDRIKSNKYRTQLMWNFKSN